jgi:exodeoxyribonuclease VII large subunit
MEATRLVPALMQRPWREADERLDGLSGRLRRGLIDRTGEGRERLAGVASRLNPGMLVRSHGEAQRRLAAARLVPSLVRRPLRDAGDRLAALARIAEQLHPEKPLARGYAIVRSAGGEALTRKTLAEKEAALTLQFADGSLAVSPQGGKRSSAPGKPRSATPKAPPSSPRQDDLFG